MDWLEEVIRFELSENAIQRYQNLSAEIASAIREEIEQRRPYAYISPDKSDEWKEGQKQALADYDYALGIKEENAMGKIGEIIEASVFETGTGNIKGIHVAEAEIKKWILEDVLLGIEMSKEYRDDLIAQVKLGMEKEITK